MRSNETYIDLGFLRYLRVGRLSVLTIGPLQRRKLGSLVIWRFAS